METSGRSPVSAEDESQQLSARVASLQAELARAIGERQQLAAIVQGSRDAIWAWDVDGTIVLWNAEAQRLFGYSAEEAIGNSLLFLVPPDRQQKARDVIATLSDRAWYGQYETVRQRKDGTEVQVELTVSPILDSQDQVVGATTICRDISDRKRYQAALTRRMNELSALYSLTDRLQNVDSVSEACHAALAAVLSAVGCSKASILLFDDSGVMRFVAWEGLSDAYRAAVEGHSPWTTGTSDPQPILVPDIDLAQESESLKDTIRKEGIRALAFIPILAADRLVGKVMTYYEAPHAFAQDEVDLAVVIARQLGFSIRKKRAEDAVRASEGRFKALTSQAPVGIFETDTEGNCLFVNEKWSQLAGMSPEAAAGRGWASAIYAPDRERVFREWYEAAATGRIFASDYRFCTPEGKVSWLEGSAVPVRDHDGKTIGYIGSVVDITDRKRAQEQQSLLINELNHRVKNTLATVQAIAAQTLRMAGADPDIYKRLEQRLMALSSAHSILTEEGWQGADIHQIIERALQPHADPQRFRVQGPPIRLLPKPSVAIAMGLHELATNAVKYGALSQDSGRVAITWAIDSTNPVLLELEWKESGGPPVEPPQRRGFGSRLIERSLAHDLDGFVTLNFPADGVICRIASPLDSIAAAKGKNA